MKHKLFHMQWLYAIVLLAVMTMTLTGCSDDNDDPTSSDLTSIIVGDWAQDGDNDIFCIHSNGTGVIYGSPELYEQKKDGVSFTWTYNNGWVKAGIAGVQEEELRVESASKNKIVWRRYESEADSGEGYLKDAFGYYELWTWERYTK